MGNDMGNQKEVKKRPYNPALDRGIELESTNV
jgi:hypothetical protein